MNLKSKDLFEDFTHNSQLQDKRANYWIKRKLFETFPELKKRYWGQHFWARGDFCVTSGEVTEEMIKNYIEHHFEPRIGENFGVET